MPRQGRRRKKTRTGKEADVGEREKKLTPRCFVIKRGDVGDRIKDLVQDFRMVMMPNSAKALKESKINRIEDFIAVASHFNVSHLIIFTATKAATYMKLARLPQGPTLTFRVD
ncbi:ppan, partial [Symbiodinium necroappetens]